MEGKKKGSAAIIFLIMALIVIAVMGYFMFKLYNEKAVAEAKVEELTTVTTELSNKSNQLQATIDNISSTIANSTGTSSSNIKYSEITKELDEESALYVTSVEKDGDNFKLKGVVYTKYTVTEAELKDAIANGKMEVYGKQYTIKADTDDSYNLYSDTSEYSVYRISKNSKGAYILVDTQGQNNTRWRITEDYREITISSSTKCSFPYGVDDDEEVKTATEVFGNFKETPTQVDILTGTSNLFYFSFANGKCSALTCAHQSI